MLKKTVLVLQLLAYACSFSIACAADSVLPMQPVTTTLALPASSIEAQSSVPATTTQATEFPVRLDGNELMVISTSPVGSLTPQKRAELVEQNIHLFAKGRSNPNTLKITQQKGGYEIGNVETVLIVITEADAQFSGKTAALVAQETLQHIQFAVTNYRAQHSWESYALGVVYTLLAILVLWQALRWNNRAFVWLASKLAVLHENGTRGLKLKGVEVLSANRLESLVLLALKVLRIFVVLLCLYFFLPLILSFFPETRKLSSTVFDYLLSPFTSIFYSFIKYLPNMFSILVIGIVAFYALKLIAAVFSLIEQGDLKFDWFYDDWARPTYQIVRFLVIVTALVSAYPYIPGSSSQAFQGVGLVLGAIISFASSSAISNIVAGVILTYTRAFRLNDRIKVGDTVGDVVEKTLLVTRVRTIKHVIITIPNSLVMGSQIINYSTSAASGLGVILHTSITIGYDVPWQQVEDLMIAAALDTDKLLSDPKPFVLQTSLDDWYVAYEINAYTKQPEKMAVIYSDLHRNIQKQFDAAGVEIMSPHYMTLRDGNASTVPSVLTAPGYVTPSFQVQNTENVKHDK
jgi:small-conductance mechanosensitive channel